MVLFPEVICLAAKHRKLQAMILLPLEMRKVVCGKTIILSPFNFVNKAWLCLTQSIIIVCVGFQNSNHKHHVDKEKLLTDLMVMYLGSLRVTVPTPPKKKREGGNVYKKLAQIVLCDVILLHENI